jgi:hypothetical protein
VNACPICGRLGSEVRTGERTSDGYCKGAATIECDFRGKVKLGVPAGIAKRDRAAAYRRLMKERAA